MRLRRLRFRMTSLIFSAVFLIWLYDRSMPISESEATRLAEDFIVRNGYTDLRPDPKIGKLTPEPIVLTSSPEEELESRHDTLARKAEGAPRGADGWMVFFRYKHSTQDPEARRSVFMDGQGHHIHIMHQDAW
ncbi:MAG: hypothetical protein ACLQGP_18495 [Isosphaeraceae bacterium]